MKLLSLRWLGVVWAGGMLAALASCAGGETSFESPESAARLRAIHEAAASNDRSSIPDLIHMLESDDAAVRLFAIRTLESMTGETFGYDATLPAHERRDAVERWNEWEQARRGDPARTTNSAPGGSRVGDPGLANDRTTQLEGGAMVRLSEQDVPAWVTGAIG